MDLVSMLVDQLGVNENQAKGGAGALFKLAQEKLSGGEFDQIAQAVPGLADMISAAPEAKSGGVMGMLGGLLGGKAGSLASLASVFSQLDLDANSIGKFVPVILDFVKQEGGDGVMDILQKVLKG